MVDVISTLDDGLFISERSDQGMRVESRIRTEECFCRSLFYLYFEIFHELKGATLLKGSHVFKSNHPFLLSIIGDHFKNAKSNSMSGSRNAM